MSFQYNAGAYVPLHSDYWGLVHADYRKGSYMSAYTYMDQKYGMSLATLKNVISQVIRDPSIDPILKKTLVNRFWMDVPVRSGKLLDTIISSLHFEHFTWYNTHELLMCKWNIPADRPQIFIGKRVAHSPPAEGVGEWGTVKLQNAIPNVSVKSVLPSGKAIYNLNDPTAQLDYNAAIEEKASELCDDYLSVLISSLVIELTLPGFQEP